MALGTTQISHPLVKSTLGESTNVQRLLCTSPNINMWSKWKPVSKAQVTGLSLTDLQAVNFGINITQDFCNAVNWAGGRNWSYTKPSGGASSPYRIGDFRSYEHASQAPFNAVGSLNWSISTAGTTHTTGITARAAAANELRYTDLKTAVSGLSLSGLRFGIIITRLSDNEVCVIKGTSATIGTLGGSANVTLDLQTLESDDYKLAYFLTQTDFSTQQTFPDPVPTSDIYILHQGVVSLTFTNNIATITFPYTFWKSDKPWDYGETEYSTQSYTVSVAGATDISNDDAILGGTGTARIIIPSSGAGKFTLTPISSFMDAFPSSKKTIVLDITEGGTTSWNVQGEKFYGIMKWLDIDGFDTVLYLRAKWDSANSENDWYLGLANDGVSLFESYIGSGDPIGEQLFVSKIEVTHSGGVSDAQIKVYVGGSGTAALTVSNQPGPAYDILHIGGGEFFNDYDLDNQYGDYMPGTYELNYYSPSL